MSSQGLYNQENPDTHFTLNIMKIYQKMKDMLTADKSLKHSRLLIPALIRIARLYGLPSYRRREVIETADISYDPFFKDKCALEHLRAYPEILEHYEQVTRIEEKADFIPQLGEALKDLLGKIVEKLKNRFGEVVDNWGNRDSSGYIGHFLASAIVSRMLQINTEFLYIQPGCKSGHCTPCYGWPNNEKSYVLGIEGIIYAVGTIDFLEDVRKFFEIEIKDELNLAEVAKFRKLGSEYTAIISSLRTLVRNLIVDIENGIPLKGECGICLGT